MNHNEFEIGKEFVFADNHYRCTDKGTRVIAAIRLEDMDVSSNNPELCRRLTREEAEAEGWFNGPPYAVVEYLIDENDQVVCEPCP